MKNTCGIAAFTTVPHPDLLVHFNRIVARFERLNDMSVRVINAEDVRELPLVDPHFARYYAWRFVPADVEKIVYFDTDVLPVWPLPQLPAEDFAAVSEIGVCADAAKTKIPLLRRTDSYFSSGFFIAGRKTEPVFDRMIAKQTTATQDVSLLAWDQTFLNIEIQTAVIMDGLSYKPLDNKWCSTHWNMSTMLEETACMVHLPALGPQKLRLLGQLVDMLDTTGGALQQGAPKS